MTENLENKTISETKEEVTKTKKTSVKIIEKPIRNLPSLINEALNNNFSVVLTQNGYYIEGFYGIKHEGGLQGYIFAQETTEQGTLVFFDSKGHKHYVKKYK